MNIWRQATGESAALTCTPGLRQRRRPFDLAWCCSATSPLILPIFKIFKEFSKVEKAKEQIKKIRRGVSQQELVFTCIHQVPASAYVGTEF
jgi:hypothetical protein